MMSNVGYQYQPNPDEAKEFLKLVAEAENQMTGPEQTMYGDLPDGYKGRALDDITNRDIASYAKHYRPSQQEKQRGYRVMDNRGAYIASILQAAENNHVDAMITKDSRGHDFVTSKEALEDVTRIATM